MKIVCVLILLATVALAIWGGVTTVRLMRASLAVRTTRLDGAR